MSSVKTFDPAARLRTVIQTGKIPHAFLFAGPGQAAAAQAAKLFAELLFCKAAEKLRPCGTCDSCRLLLAKTHPDARWISPEDSGTIKIETIREFVREASFKPFREQRRVFVIRRAEAMNEHAQNALLKTLEEPPGPSHFLLLAESPESLLATVRSRVQRLYFPVDARPAAAAADIEEAARKEALDYLLGQTDRAPDWISWERAALLRVLEAVVGDLRDVLMITAGAPALSRAEHKPFKERAAHALDGETLIEVLEKVSSLKESIRQNANIKLALSVLWTEARTERV